MSPSPPSAFDPWFQARCPDVPLSGARGVLELAAEGHSAPFIARYRRDRTGNLDEEAVRRVLGAHEQWERVLARQTIILESIERHATMSPELREKVLGTFDGDALEDLYLPFKQKKKSRAAEAREAGLGQLADWIWSCGHGTETPQEGQTLELWAFTFRDPDKGVPDAKTAIEGARDILVERLAEDAGLRARVREAYVADAWLRAAKTEKAQEGSRFEPFFDFKEKVASILKSPEPQRYLTLRKGQSEGVLLLSVTGPPEDEEFEAKLVAIFEEAALSEPDSPGAEVLRQAARIAFKGHVRTAMENEAHQRLKEAGDAAVARAHAQTLRRLLREPAFGRKPVLGIDPGARSGSPVAAVDAQGGCRASGIIHLGTDERKEAARALVVGLVREHGLEAVAVGDRAAGRECELFVRAALKDAGIDIPVVLVPESGASSWAGSEALKPALGELDPPARSAVFVARRLQDPLAELVVVEPRTLCGRQHAHDVAPAVLIRALNEVVESVVHEVAVDPSSAPRALLARVSGVGPVLAGAIAEHREKEGPFRSREGLKAVPDLGEREFEKCAGFLRIADGEQPFDATGVHPGHYAALTAAAERLGKNPAELRGPGAAALRDDAALKDELGPFTLDAVVQELERDGVDPRGPFAPFTFRDDVRTLEDLKPGMVCPGIVSSVASFGAFVDVGAGQDGLVHVSQLGRPGKSPAEAIVPGERVEARVLKVDRDKKQVSLSLKPAPPRRPPQKRPSPRPAGDGRTARQPADKGQRRDRPRDKGQRKPGPRPPARPPRERRPAFNNPFAVLADMKLPKKGKG